MPIDPRYKDPVNEAFDYYVKTRKLKESMQILTEAATEGRIDLGLFDEAKNAFGVLLDELARNEDGVIENEWEVLCGKSLTELIGIEHTERGIDPAKGGSVETIAEGTCP